MPASEPSVLSEAVRALSAHDKVVEDRNLKETQCLFEPARDALICRRGLAVSARMVVAIMCLAAFCALNFESR